jgi:glycolate oxidase FAD binding subunit
MHTLKPASVDELAAALRASFAAGHRVGITGAATKRAWTPPGDAVDATLDTTGLQEIVEHAPGDLVVTVQSGVRLRDLQDALRPHRQWLALDPPESDATIGGIVAAAASGPRRLRFGPPRDLVLGVTVVLADGTVARSGGKVVKNVAGYDLARLFTGAFGTLGVIATVTLRLHPVLVARRVVTVDTDAPAPATRTVLRSPVPPTAIEWNGSTLCVVVESSEAAVDAQAAHVAECIGGRIGDDVPSWFGQRPWHADGLGLKVTHRIGALADAVADVRELASDARLQAHAGSGVLWAGVGPDRNVLDALRGRTSAYDGTVVAVNVPESLQGRVDVWGPVRGLDVMRRIKDQFDPEHRLNPGRFVGGI